jgi:hypothetical protein
VPLPTTRGKEKKTTIPPLRDTIDTTIISPLPSSPYRATLTYHAGLFPLRQREQKKKHTQAYTQRNMDRPSSALFEVFLRLRPSDVARERFLTVERATINPVPTHITIKPPSDDKRKRAVERFGFTRVFEEDAGQLDLFRDAGAVSMIEGVLGARGREGRDGLLATLGVTGSGKVWHSDSSVMQYSADH